MPVKLFVNRDRYLTIVLLYIALFIRAMILLSPVMLLFYQENGLTVKELFFFQGFFYLTQIILELPIGYISDIFPKKKVLIASFFIFLSGIVLWYFMKGYWVILFGEILFAISKVSMDISTSGYLYDYLKTKNMENKMPKYLGYMNFFLAAGTATVGVLGAFLYQKFGSSNVLILEMILITCGIIMLSMLNNIPSYKDKSLKLAEKYKDFIESVKLIWQNLKIRDYMLYSGLLTSISILFALSFQPLMQMAFFPIVLFGIVGSMNHGIRALFSVLAGKFPFNIHKARIPLYILYILSFGAIFILNFSKNVKFNFILITFICLVIGLQLMFTILHVSRLHKFVESSYRGMLMSVNNVVPKILTVIILMSVHFFMQNTEMWKFFLFYFVFFVGFGLYLVLKTRKITE